MLTASSPQHQQPQKRTVGFEMAATTEFPPPLEVTNEWHMKKGVEKSLKEAHRRHRIANLMRVHQPLVGHWSVRADTKRNNLDASDSDLNYKMHVARLKQIYLNHVSDFVLKMKEKTTGDMTLPQSACNHLYGHHGLVNNAPWVKRWQKKQENNWRDDFVYCSSLKDPPTEGPVASLRTALRSQHASLSSSTPSTEWANEVAGSSSSRGGVGNSPNKLRRPSSASAASRRSHGMFTNGHNPPFIRNRSHQKVPEEDLVLLGYYWLNDQQGQVYAEFVRLLSEFDGYDAARIMEDSISDAKACYSLDGYGGIEKITAPSSSSVPPNIAMGSRARDTIANQGGNRRSLDAQESGEGPAPPIKSKYQQQQLLAEELRRRLRFSDLEGVTPVDSVMLGLYQLNDEQSRVYGAFVELLSSGFDRYDIQRIVQDAAADAMEFSPLLKFTGTSLKKQEENTS